MELSTEHVANDLGDQQPSLPSGSIWQRWEPHIHGPGTVLNDQFKGSNAFEDYLLALEQASPEMRAVGVTDYYSTEVYEAIVQAKASGRLRNCDLIFPNIELRFDVGTVKGAWVNAHLLVNPQDPDHLNELNRFLARLRFDAYKDSFHCTKTDLIRLGKKADPTITDDHKALKSGSIQFKVSFKQLKEEFHLSEWARNNILIAVSAGADGTGGVRDGADKTLREEIESLADIMFASSESQREFWLGKRVLNPDQIISRYGGLKPCMHGSDAHKPEDVGAPVGDRYTWIKGVAKFDSLVQACIDPEGRAYVGTYPPLGATPSQTIAKVEVNNTSWCQTPSIDLNPGLVAIIGARGSGKTALAEIIAAGCDAISEEESNDEKSKSFLNRASSELVGSTVSLHWGGDAALILRSLQRENLAPDSYPMARYLSQQFVDELCSSDGVTDKLLKELERIIFNSHDINQREGTIDFSSLLELKASLPRANRDREEKALQDVSDRIGLESDKIKLVEETKQKIIAKDVLIKQYNVDRSKLVTKGSEDRVKRLGDLSAAADKVRAQVRAWGLRQQSLVGIQNDVKNVRVNRAPEELRVMQDTHLNSGLKTEDWKPFLTDFTGDVDSILTSKLNEATKASAAWKGTSPTNGNPQQELIPVSADLLSTPLALLEAEIKRLTDLISTDKDTALKYTAISTRITQEQGLVDGLRINLIDYEGAQERIKNLRTERDASYGRVFDALLEEESILSELYSPIMAKLSSATGTMQKMSFSIKRTADVEAWAERGEQLFDLREVGPFKGKGTLRKLGEEILQPAWETGDVATVQEAMNQFRIKTQQSLLEMSKVSKSDKQSYRAWAMSFAKWLYSTDHIQINYGVEYDGVDIKKLSPGTRGIVLLLLYLALDDEDDRPLIIDQPEENLDPKSIYDELVGLFIAAKHKRQVIMVTHNANLVINTDADQIIIAQTGERLPSGMPKISYLSGGLEEAHIRKEVCGILEGGEAAFKKRAERLRVSLK